MEVKMRAIILCDTLVENNDLESILSEINWLPNMEDDNLELLERKKEILEHIPKDAKKLVESTFVCTIYDDETKTWGIVNRPNKHRLSFRLKNPVSDRLKKASIKLVSDMRTNKHTDGKFKFDFLPRVEVLEPGNENYSFAGEILPPHRLKLAISQRKTESYVAIFAGIIAIVLLIVTSPIILPVKTNSWEIWFSGTLERFSTAALVTMTISAFEVFLHWSEIRRQDLIKWVFE
jgi:hypothetical protein